MKLKIFNSKAAMGTPFFFYQKKTKLDCKPILKNFGAQQVMYGDFEMKIPSQIGTFSCFQFPQSRGIKNEHMACKYYFISRQ